MGDNKLHLLKLVNVHYLTNISRRRAHKTEIILELCYNAHVTYRPIKRTLYTKLSTFIGRQLYRRKVFLPDQTSLPQYNVKTNIPLPVKQCQLLL